MTIIVDQTAINRIHQLRAQQSAPALKLRITVEGGGCSGFQYKMDLTQQDNHDDKIFDGVIITDEISLPFLSGSVIKFEEALIGSEFKIENPNAVAGCGCGTSFSVAGT